MASQRVCHRGAVLGTPPPAPFDRSRLLLARDLRRRGVEPTRAGTPGAREFVQVRRGVWIRTEDWEPLPPVTRHAALVHASALVADPDSDAVYSHQSAAAVWGMPRIEDWSSRVHVTTMKAVGSSALVERHEVELDACLVHQGLRLTTPARTVVDVARTSSLQSGLAAADFALRHDLTDIGELWEEIRDLPPRSRNKLRAELVGELADGRSMSPGESLSRAQLFLLDLPRPDLQVRHEDDQGLIGIVDFGWDGVVGEFDGKVKYRVPEGATPDEAAKVLWEEKRREDRLRRRGLRVGRWTYADALAPEKLLRLLGEQGVRPQARNTWIDLAPARRRSVVP